MADNENRTGRRSRVLNFENVLMAVILVLTVWNAYTITVINHRVKTLELQLDSAERRLEVQSIVLIHHKSK